MPTEITMTRLRSYRTMRERLIEAKTTEFKTGRIVRVANDRYHGYGLIVLDESCPPDQLAVKLENGNTWWYPLEDCSIGQRDSAPSWLQRLVQNESKSVIRRLTAQKATP